MSAAHHTECHCADLAPVVEFLAAVFRKAYKEDGQPIPAVLQRPARSPQPVKRPGRPSLTVLTGGES